MRLLVLCWYSAVADKNCSALIWRACLCHAVTTTAVRTTLLAASRANHRHISLWACLLSEAEAHGVGQDARASAVRFVAHVYGGSHCMCLCVCVLQWSARCSDAPADRRPLSRRCVFWFSRCGHGLMMFVCLLMHHQAVCVWRGSATVSLAMAQARCWWSACCCRGRLAGTREKCGLMATAVRFHIPCFDYHSSVLRVMLLLIVW